MSAIDKKLAEHLGWLILENIKLQAALEEARAQVTKLQTAKVAEHLAKTE